MKNNRCGLIDQPTDDGRCEVKVLDSKGWHTHRCPFRAKVTVDGVHYCGNHDPLRRAKKQEEKNERWREKKKKREYEIYATLFCKKQNLTLKDLMKKIEEYENAK